MNSTVVKEHTLYNFKFYNLLWLVLTENVDSSVNASWAQEGTMHLLLDPDYLGFFSILP